MAESAPLRRRDDETVVRLIVCCRPWPEARVKPNWLHMLEPRLKIILAFNSTNYDFDGIAENLKNSFDGMYG
jgi:hypothetical protein